MTNLTNPDSPTKLVNVFQLFNALSEEPKTSTKLKILRENSELPWLTDILELTYNPRHNYGVVEIGSFKVQDKTDSDQLGSVVNIARYLNAKYYEGSAREVINNNAGYLDDRHRGLLQKILRRDLRIGMAGTQINKVFKGLIPETPYMRCSTINQVKVKEWSNWNDGHFLQLKADGMFQRCILTQDSIQFVSRSGEVLPSNVIEWAQQFHKEITASYKYDHFYEGELLVYDSHIGKHLSRQEGNGYINSLVHGAEKLSNREIDFVVWDHHLLSALEKQTDLPYHLRYTIMLENLKHLKNVTQVIPITTHIVHDTGEVVSIVTNWMNAGFEGGVLKHREGVWKDGTSKYQVKLKKCFEVEVRVTGFKEGKPGTKRQQTFGSIEYESECGQLKGYVSGINEALLKKINSNRESYLNKIMTIAANDVMQDREGNMSLSHPRFIEFRDDKVLADDLESIVSQCDAACDSFFG